MIEFFLRLKVWVKGLFKGEQSAAARFCRTGIFEIYFRDEYRERTNGGTFGAAYCLLIKKFDEGSGSMMQQHSRKTNPLLCNYEQHTMTIFPHLPLPH